MKKTQKKPVKKKVNNPIQSVSVTRFWIIGGFLILGSLVSISKYGLFQGQNFMHGVFIILAGYLYKFSRERLLGLRNMNNEVIILLIIIGSFFLVPMRGRDELLVVPIISLICYSPFFLSRILGFGSLRLPKGFTKWFPIFLKVVLAGLVILLIYFVVSMARFFINLVVESSEQSGSVVSDYILENNECEQKYPGTMYRAGDGQCICENGVIWSDNGTCEVVKKSTTVKSSTVVNTSISNDQQCNQKYPGTVYRASDDRCICSNGQPRKSSTFCSVPHRCDNANMQFACSLKQDTCSDECLDRWAQKGSMYQY